MFSHSGNKIKLTTLILASIAGFYFLQTLIAESRSTAIETGHNYMMTNAYTDNSTEVPRLFTGISNQAILSVINLITPYIKNNATHRTISEEEYNNRYYSLPMIYPVPGNVRISSGFGMRTDPFTGRPAFHNGIDLPLRTGTPVRATGNGYCLQTGVDSLLGVYVIINHNDEYESIYGHLSSVNIRAGERVKSGEIIGISGNTGRSTNPHLHYQVNHRGLPVDPVSLKEELNERRWVMLY
jgi:murein DD-endopeptidase MepM/ murein hydrolase activator NlpD